MRNLTATLVVLSFVTGLLDAVSYLGLGHVFAANQTGNVIVLGFALVGTSGISGASALASLASFVVGAAISGWVTTALDSGSRERWLGVMFALEGCLLGLALLTTAVPVLAADTVVTVSILAFAMGMRTVTVQRLEISAVSTTVVTTMLATLAGSGLRRRARWEDHRLRIAAVAAMLTGAASGAVLLEYGATVVLSVASGLSLAIAARFAMVRERTERNGSAPACCPGDSYSFTYSSW